MNLDRIALLQIACHLPHAIRHGGTLRQIRLHSLDGWHFGATSQHGFDLSATPWDMGSYQVCSLGLSFQREWSCDMDYQHIGIYWQLSQGLSREAGTIPCAPSAYHACSLFVWLALWGYYFPENAAVYPFYVHNTQFYPRGGPIVRL